MPINLSNKHRFLSLLIVVGGLVLALTASSVVETFAAQSPVAELLPLQQQPSETPRPTVTPPEGPITLDDPLPACQLYYVSDVRAPVRTCAGSDCTLVDTLPQYDVICVRGITDNPDWLIVSVATEDTSAPLYAIEKSKVTPGPAPSQDERYEDCWYYVEIAQATIGNVNLRQCPALDCPVLDTLEEGEWACVREHGGQYNDWLRADIPNGLNGVWISDQVMELLSVDYPATSVVEVAQNNTETPEAAATDAPSATPEPAAPTETPSPTPACTQYVVDVAGAGGGNLRSCPSIECEIVETLPQNMALCVTGPAEESGWLTVDRNPDDPADELVYISQEIVQLGGADSPSLIQPTATFTPTLPVCAPGSALADCVTMTPTPVLAVAPTVMPTGPLLAQEISLETLDVPSLELNSPFGYTQFDFSLPSDWVAAGNNVLYLDLNYFETGDDSEANIVNDVELVSVLDVLLNDDLIAAVTLNETTTGRQTIAIPLPLAQLDDPTNRDHTIQLQFRAEDHCLSRETSQTFIHNDSSYFHFEFRQTLPVLDLALYPRPLYNQRFVNEQEVVYIVLPDDPTANDYRVAMALASGLGLLTFNEMNVELATTSELSDLARTTNNLLLVGQIGENELIDQYYDADLFPTSLSDSGNLSLDGLTINQDEGVVQIIQHPENENLAVVTVTGQSDEALLKAGQALAGPPSLLGVGGSAAVIAETRPLDVPSLGGATDRTLTFEELGYPQINMGGYGTSTQQISFFMPAGYTLTDEAYIDLVFNYSGVLQGSRATIAVLLNGDTPIASDYLSQRRDRTTSDDADATLNEPKHLRARIPADAVTGGARNTLTIVVNVHGDWECYPPDATIGWVTIFGESEIGLPRTRVASDQLAPMVGWFPSPFNAEIDMGNVWISLPENVSTDIAEQAMAVLGRVASSVDGGEGFMPQVSIGELPSNVDLSQYDFMVFGRNTTNPFLAELNQNLPQPFVDNTDNIVQNLDDVEYRLPPGFEVGLLEVVSSPWNEENIILLISGTGPGGQANAAAALSDYRYGAAQLMGDVVFVSDASASTVDTRELGEDADVDADMIDALNELEVTATPEAPEGATRPQRTMQPDEEQTAEPVAAVTATPLPTITLVPTVTAGPTLTPTFIFTLTPEPTVPTPLPTFEPLTEQDLEPQELDEPEWFLVLVLVTGILVITTLIFALVRMRRSERDRQL